MIAKRNDLWRCLGLFFTTFSLFSSSPGMQKFICPLSNSLALFLMTNSMQGTLQKTQGEKEELSETNINEKQEMAPQKIFMQWLPNTGKLRLPDLFPRVTNLIKNHPGKILGTVVGSGMLALLYHAKGQIVEEVKERSNTVRTKVNKLLQDSAVNKRQKLIMLYIEELLSESSEYINLDKLTDKDSVDDYIAWCGERGETPEKSFSGHLKLRIPPDLHKKLAKEASQTGVSLNSLIAEKLKH